jgi:hypothetical protein
MSSFFKPGRIAWHLCIIIGTVFLLACCASCPPDDPPPTLPPIPIPDPTPPPHVVPQAHAIPLTDEIIAEVGGIAHTVKFQYYISKTITLRLIARRSTPKISENGQLIRINSVAYDTVTISANTPGVMKEKDYQQNTNPLLGYSLNVHFEEKMGNLTIQFGKRTSSAAAKYQIVNNGGTSSTINYGGLIYSVNYEGDEPPYLLIKAQEIITETENSRRASGVTLDKH